MDIRNRIYSMDSVFDIGLVGKVRGKEKKGKELQTPSCLGINPPLSRDDLLLRNILNGWTS